MDTTVAFSLTHTQVVELNPRGNVLFLKCGEQKHCISVKSIFLFGVHFLCPFILVVFFCMRRTVCVHACQTWQEASSPFSFSPHFFHFPSPCTTLCLPASPSATDWLISQPGMRDSLYRYTILLLLLLKIIIMIIFVITFKSKIKGSCKTCG